MRKMTPGPGRGAASGSSTGGPATGGGDSDSDAQGAAPRMSLMPVAGQRSPDFPVPGLRRACASRPPREQMSAPGPASLQRPEAPGCSSYIFASDAEPFLSALVRYSPTSTRRCQKKRTFPRQRDDPLAIASTKCTAIRSSRPSYSRLRTWCERDPGVSNGGTTMGRMQRRGGGVCV